MNQSQENLRTDGRMDKRMERWTDRPYFIGLFQPWPGVQQRKRGRVIKVIKKKALELTSENKVEKKQIITNEIKNGKVVNILILHLELVGFAKITRN